jgi:zinc protease
LNEYLDIVLIDEIREALGGVYSVSSWVSVTPLPNAELSGGAYFTCDPKRVEELVTAVKEEFAKVSRGSIDSGVLQKAIEALIKEQEESIQSNIYIAQSYANSAVIYHSPLSRLDKRPALYRTVKAADIQKAAQELLGGSQVRLTLNPE